MKVVFLCVKPPKKLCKPSGKGFSIRYTGLQLLFSELATFCSKSSEQLDSLFQEHHALKCGVDVSNQYVKEHVDEVEILRRQLIGEAEKKLVSARQKHETLVDKEKKRFNNRRFQQ